MWQEILHTATGTRWSNYDVLRRPEKREILKKTVRKKILFTEM